MSVTLRSLRSELASVTKGPVAMRGRTLRRALRWLSRQRAARRVAHPRWLSRQRAARRVAVSKPPGDPTISAAANPDGTIPQRPAHISSTTRHLL